MSTNQLISELDCRYRKLQELLVAKKWRKADIETYKIMLFLTYPETANRQDIYNLGIDFIINDINLILDFTNNIGSSVIVMPN
ncbi:GUN4 domain-containing protein [Synechocystis sp. PCC 7509]|uniref:GUN4 domain-containing protein n=1 Tax=Synechocystis sp. PCC 7509 TaxID=927677 RepID=UPI0002ACAF88|nr:GUN4 domain-containing protein [Synechocystis sp. PCC 7509]